MRQPPIIINNNIGDVYGTDFRNLPLAPILWISVDLCVIKNQFY